MKTTVLPIISALFIMATNCLAGESKFLPYVLGADEGEAIAFPPHSTRRLADPDSNQAGLSLFEIVIPAKSGGAPPHIHTHEDEFFYVRSGKITFLINEARKTVSAGGFTMLPRGSLHALWNTGEEETILLVGTSDGKFGDYFDGVAMEVRNKNAKTPQEVGEIMGRLGAERGITILMDKVPEDVASLYGLGEQ